VVNTPSTKRMASRTSEKVLPRAAVRHTSPFYTVKYQNLHITSTT